MICTICEDEILPGTKFLVVFATDNKGFYIREFCTHGIHEALEFMEMARTDPNRLYKYIGVAGSMKCLSELIWNYTREQKEKK